MNVFKGWDAATWVCSIKGHVAPAATVAVVDERDRAGRPRRRRGRDVAPVALPALRRLGRPDRIPTAPGAGPAAAVDHSTSSICLAGARRCARRSSCGSSPSSGASTRSALPSSPYSDCCSKPTWSACRARPGGWSTRSAMPRTRRAQTNNHSILVQEGAKVLHLRAGTLNILIAAAVAYAVIEGVEAIGLWRERRWAEYLTVLATAGFLPLEIHELLKRVTVFRVSALVVNIAILVYLLYAKRLFGLARWRPRTGEEIDWAAVLRPPAGNESAATVPTGEPDTVTTYVVGGCRQGETTMRVPLTIGDFLDRAASSIGDRTAVVDEPGTPGSFGTITYRSSRRGPGAWPWPSTSWASSTASGSPSSAPTRPASSPRTSASAATGGSWSRSTSGSTPRRCSTSSSTPARRSCSSTPSSTPPWRGVTAKERIVLDGRQDADLFAEAADGADARAVGARRGRHGQHQLHHRHDGPAQGRAAHPSQLLAQRRHLRLAHRRSPTATCSCTPCRCSTATAGACPTR